MLEDKDTANGTRALLTEIRKHQKDMPAEVVDDMTFGALVVLYDMGQSRGRKLKGLGRWAWAQAAALLAVVTAIVALHADVPWLTGLLERIFGA